MSLITDWNVKYRIVPKGVIHVGASIGEEVDEYCAIQPPPPVMWLEPNAILIPELNRRVLTRPGHEVFNVAAGDRDSTEMMNICDSSHFQCSSLLPFGTHKQQYPHIDFTGQVEVRVRKLDTLFADRIDAFDYLYCDTQGYEIFVLRGAENLLKHVKWCYLEYGDEELYRGSGVYADLAAFLKERGFAPKEKADLGYHWGDCLFGRLP